MQENGEQLYHHHHHLSYPTTNKATSSKVERNLIKHTNKEKFERNPTFLGECRVSSFCGGGFNVSLAATQCLKLHSGREAS